MNEQGDRTANLLGALTLMAGGHLRDAVNHAVGAGGTLADAVIVIKDQPGRTIDWLGQILRISQPGAVHLVRRLTELGWVDKRPGSDGRTRTLWLTPAGNHTAAQLLQARHQALTDLLEPLTADQHQQLAGIAETMLHARARNDQDLARLCRLCDRSRCPHCPAYAGVMDHDPADGTACSDR